MNHMCGVQFFFLQLDNTLEFRLSKIKEIEDFFIAEISDKEKMSKTLNKYKKQPPEVFCKKRCSEKLRKIHRKRVSGTGVFL